jgi:hypothetical protein
VTDIRQLLQSSEDEFHERPNQLTKISILVSNLSGNCLGRAYVLAKVLERKYAVQILGFAFDGSIWLPHATDFTYVSIKGRCLPQFADSAIQLTKKISGDIVFALKPRPTSLGVGLLKRMIGKHTPVILDIDDWESAFQLDSLSHSFLNSRYFLDTDSLHHLF